MDQYVLAMKGIEKSFGVPVLRDAAPGGRGQEDSYFRTPWQKMRRAGRFIAEETNEE